MKTILVAGAGGFIGGHLVRELLHMGGAKVRAVDIKSLDRWYQCFGEADSRTPYASIYTTLGCPYRCTKRKPLTVCRRPILRSCSRRFFILL